MSLILYWIVKIFGTPIFYLLFRPKYINKKNIPKNVPVVLAGNHKSNFDCASLVCSTNRVVHFLAKKELLDTKMKWFFKGMGIIPVDRKNKNPQALQEAIKNLNENKVIGIFPEGTTNKTNDIIMPFKYGAVKMASETNAYIVPFSITGEYKFFGRLKITFGEAYKIGTDLEQENKILMNKVIDLIKGEKDEWFLL